MRPSAALWPSLSFRGAESVLWLQLAVNKGGGKVNESASTEQVRKRRCLLNRTQWLFVAVLQGLRGALLCLLLGLGSCLAGAQEEGALIPSPFFPSRGTSGDPGGTAYRAGTPQEQKGGAAVQCRTRRCCTVQDKALLYIAGQGPALQGQEAALRPCWGTAAAGAEGGCTPCLAGCPFSTFCSRPK